MSSWSQALYWYSNNKEKYKNINFRKFGEQTLLRSIAGMKVIIFKNERKNGSASDRKKRSDILKFEIKICKIFGWSKNCWICKKIQQKSIEFFLHAFFFQTAILPMAIFHT